MMVRTDDPSCIWVDQGFSGKSDGSALAPFCTIAQALERLDPGYTIVIREGTYHEQLTIERSGSHDLPIRICADTSATVVVEQCGWYLYDVSDCIISGIQFVNSPGTALSVIGACERNRFERLTFLHCGTEKQSACTLFFGGSGNNCNVVEYCLFDRTPQAGAPPDVESKSVGVLVSHGPAQGQPNTNLLLCNSIIRGYGYGILLGTDELSDLPTGHRIESNWVQDCLVGGISVKSSDALIRGNRLHNSGMSGISVLAVSGCAVESNRIEVCHTGITVCGGSHSIENNSILLCKDESIALIAKPGASEKQSTTVIVEANTCYGASTAVRFEPQVSCVVQNNLFVGQSRVWHPELAAERTATVIAENHIVNCPVVDGCSPVAVCFADIAMGDLSNSSGKGASGDHLCPVPAPFTPQAVAAFFDTTPSLVDFSPVTTSEEDEDSAAQADAAQTRPELSDEQEFMRSLFHADEE